MLTWFCLAEFFLLSSNLQVHKCHASIIITWTGNGTVHVSLDLNYLFSADNPSDIIQVKVDLEFREKMSSNMVMERNVFAVCCALTLSSTYSRCVWDPGETTWAKLADVSCAFLYHLTACFLSSKIPSSRCLIVSYSTKLLDMFSGQCLLPDNTVDLQRLTTYCVVQTHVQFSLDMVLDPPPPWLVWCLLRINEWMNLLRQQQNLLNSHGSKVP